MRYNRQRRPGVSAQAVTKARLEAWRPPVFPKSEDERSQILSCFDRMTILFGHLDHAEKNRVVDATFRVEVAPGQCLIEQGAVGDNFYIVEAGQFDILVARDGNSPTKVNEAVPGGSFGELALLYNSPRAATVRAVTPSVVWALDRDTFQLMIVTAENTKKKTYEDFLENVQIFRGLNKYERVKLSDMLVPSVYRPGESIVLQDEQGDRFFIVTEGEAICTRNDGNAELVLCHYGRGGYFGELALMGDGVRRASVFATSRCHVLSIDKATFDRVLGPIMDIFRSNMELYEKILTEKQTEWLKRRPSR
eukprot:Protomagalhaensia_sp_Gyna_25__382@NODE_1180_length_2093_cov_148_861733_g937_i0_p1_GENE_NODE_1180_length_2093_cov_148_861733_g937_i0NODE_1180_length_2093_cov_148_861733_g937_i0_p1_ORF_typecomplete_len307_score33_25cNMP_binding/PF00027_29/1_9e23cNMP_binding/PF00027_29/6_2e19Cupin_2/PF07883_11/1_6e03Cupin_2/PF07883_11/0_44_NODE_1180_length_2093_cov_148_861733_g937_i011382058